MLRCRQTLCLRRWTPIPSAPKRSSRAIHLSRPRREEEGERYDPRSVERVEDEVDVCIVGAGPAGLSAAIRIKQLEREKGKEVRVVVLEKGGEVGSHILSGCVLEPRALHELLGSPSTYAEKYGSEAPLGQPATSSKMLLFTNNTTIPIPHPPQMNNDGNYIISLSQFTRWLASVAEEHYGVEIYPGFAGAGLLFSEEPNSDDPWNGWEGRWGKSVTKSGVTSGTSGSSKRVKSVQGVITNDVGISKSGYQKSNFEPGMAFRSKVTLLAEGAHGSLSKIALSKYNLRKESEGQTYGFGLKEVWRIAPDDGSEGDGRYKPGEVVHSIGWPLDNATYGGGWVYHMDKGLVSIGLVIGADWSNPYRSPYRDFQKMKHHPYFRKLLTPSNSPNTFTPSRIAYGARVLVEGGLQSVPLLHFPGGALIGDSAGFVNLAKIKGVHNSMKTGMMGGEGAFNALYASEEGSEESSQKPADLSSYTEAFTKSWVYDDLHEVRNMRPAFNTSLGVFGGVMYSGVDSLLLKGRTPWTFKHSKAGEREKYINSTPTMDSTHTERASKHKPIDYPPFEAPLSTDLLTSVSLTSTNHEEDQPEHLRVATLQEYVREWYGDDTNILSEPDKNGLQDKQKRRRSHVQKNVEEYAGLLGRACPAGVYEYVDDQSGTSEGGWNGKKLVINAQNCIHCKLCDVKVPTQDITWTVPEGGGGPKYSIAKEEHPIEPTSPSAPKRPTAFSKAKGYLATVGILLGCAWLLSPNDDNLHYPTFRVSSNHHVAKEPVCQQTGALTPDQNLFFWTLLAEEISTDEFQEKAVKLLGGAVQVETEMFDDMGPVDEDPRWKNRATFHDYLKGAFPEVHSKLELTKINTYGLLYTWKGYDKTLKPYILAAHQDVVPVNPTTVDEWAHPPYSGHFDGERIWGRGSRDDKSGLIGILSAVEILLQQEFQPARTVILSFGFDEEAGGYRGAGELSKHLLETYGKDSIAFMIDEGSGFSEQYGTVFATPGIAEKGSMNVDVNVATRGGHSSIPPRHTSIGILAALLVHIEENPFEPHLERDTPMYDFVQCLGAHATQLPPALRKAIKRSQRSDQAFKEIEKHMFSDAVFKSLVGTTQAIDMIEGGVKSNALPEEASAVVNHRIATTSSGDATKVHDRDLLVDLAKKFNLSYVAFGEQVSEPDVPSKGRLTLTAPRALDPAPVTPTKGENAAPYQLLSGTIKATYNAHRSLTGDNIVVAPGMMTGNTDTRFYWDLTEHLFRYNHHNLGKSTNALSGAHTVNESVPFDSFLEIIRFFGTLILNADETTEF